MKFSKLEFEGGISNFCNQKEVTRDIYFAAKTKKKLVKEDFLDNTKTSHPIFLDSS